MKSIIQTEKQCYFCHTTKNLHLHHCLTGCRRKTADKNGLTVWLCAKHHIEVHGDNGKVLALKRIAQRKYEETHSREEFISVFGKSYLGEVL